MAVTGRGAWTKIGMPANGTIYYQLLSPERVGEKGTLIGADLSHRAVMYGVKQIQTRINKLGYQPVLVVDGKLGPTTDAAIRWTQKRYGLSVDGQAGPNTCKALFWPAIQRVAKDHPSSMATDTLAHTIGGICQHESGFDPGAVGYSTPDDLGLVQINGPANPTMLEADRFSYRRAFDYCANRMVNAWNTYHNLDYAICSYASPLWAQQWAQTGVPPNQSMVDYANYVKTWVPPVIKVSTSGV